MLSGFNENDIFRIKYISVCVYVFQQNNIRYLRTESLIYDIRVTWWETPNYNNFYDQDLYGVSYLLWNYFYLLNFIAVLQIWLKTKCIQYKFIFWFKSKHIYCLTIAKQQLIYVNLHFQQWPNFRGWHECKNGVQVKEVTRINFSALALFLRL